jgi:hypothetical protein
MSDHAPEGGARNDRAHTDSPSSALLRRAWDDAECVPVDRPLPASVPAAHWPGWTDRHRYTITRQLGRREGSR